MRRDFGTEPELAASNDPPKVFVRVIVTPPASPWEQTRAAALDARHGAPLPLSELLQRMKRISSWAPGRPGRFAAFYVRAKEYRAPFETDVDVEGQLVRVAFGTSGEQVRRARQVASVLVMLIAVGAVAGTGIALALNVRRQGEMRLAATEALVTAKVAAIRTYRRQAAMSRTLQLAVGQARPVSSVVEDLAWVTAEKTPDARIAAVHWQGGVMAVEVRGEQPPFIAPDRRLERSAKPLRSGIWLWGVGPRPRPSAVPSAQTEGAP